MSDSTGEFGWGLRLLIMAYGFGLVVIGLDPIKKGHGSLANFLSRDSIVRAAEAIRSSTLVPPGNSSPRNVDQAGESAPNVQQSERKLDQLTAQDRKQLNKLMEGL